MGDAVAIALVEVTWPATGIVQVFESLELDRAYRLRESVLLATEVALSRFDLSP